MSTSVGDDISAGSRTATSWAIGRLSVWSVASTSAGGRESLLRGPTTTTTNRPINATATPALAGTYRRNPGRGRGAGTTGSDSEDYLARALAPRDHSERLRRFRQGHP